uniref:Phospholipase B1, membrane-associated n=1 Tax=Panagrellus redivivus TaxID=6233 RepID=A0A7E4ZW18_PANRE
MKATMWRVVSSTLLIEVLFVANSYGLKDLGVPGFECPNMGPSASVPISAHAVRPADIKIVAALGDSLTAGNGAGAQPGDPLALLLQYRGLSFGGGGDKNLSQHVTIPNILRAFNPSVFGYALGISANDVWAHAHLNLGFPGAESGDLPGQAKKLVQLMNAHKEVDVQNDWKLVNIFIGGNDICAYCQDSLNNSNGPHTPENFANGIRQAVQILKDHLPRTIVSLTGMFNMVMLRQIDHKEVFCQLLHIDECPCESDTSFTDAEIANTSIGYMNAERVLQTSGEFDTTDDFTLVMQPFFQDIVDPPRLANGTVEYEFFAADCFHFSQLGHAVVSKYLWNNIMQPVGSKQTTANLSNVDIALQCPDADCPFIRTTKNSQNCQKYAKTTLY